jgi:hypothetical protein
MVLAGSRLGGIGLHLNFTVTHRLSVIFRVMGVVDILHQTQNRYAENESHIIILEGKNRICRTTLASSFLQAGREE